MAQTSAHVLAVFKTMFEQGVQEDYNNSTPAIATLTREGKDMATAARETRFAIKTRSGQTARTYSDDPTEFSTCDAPPDYEYVCLTYKKDYIPYEISNEVIVEGTPEGAMFDVLKQDLEDLIEQSARHDERMFLTGDGRDILFAMDGTENDNGDGTFTYGVKWYAGRQGEMLGEILEALTLCGMEIHVAEACGVAPVTTQGRTIVGVDPTPGAETITVDGQISALPPATQVTDGMVAYRSRNDNAGIQGCTDGKFGLPALIDDFSEVEPFQCLSEDDCQVFKSTVMSNGGVLRDLDEDILSRAISSSKVRRPLKRGETPGFQNFVFFGHEFTERRFANTLTSIRQLTAPNLWGRRGIRPAFGVEMDALTFDGIPFISSQLALRNSLYLADVSKLILLHNGPAEGQFLATPDGNTYERKNCSPIFQCVWWKFTQFAVRDRKGMVKILDLNSWTDM